ncbi:MAG: transporter associated domain-containing protein, partial [Actinomycetota bacterium]
WGDVYVSWNHDMYTVEGPDGSEYSEAYSAAELSEILDEYDEGEAGIERLGQGRFIVPDTLRIDECAERLGIELPEGPYETIAGFLMDRLGRIPVRRDAVMHDGWTLRVRSMKRRRVLQVLIEPPRS